MSQIADKLRQEIYKKIPEGSVIPQHTEKAHFYQVGEIVYPSVTASLAILKDESLINYKMNEALRYVFKYWKEFNDENIIDHLESAENAPQVRLEDAGDIGTEIHDIREKIFRDWIFTGKRPEDFLSYIPEDPIKDLRAISAIRALDKFCTEWEYEPVVTELYVYSHKLKYAGTLDDLGLMKKVIRPGDPNCEHEMFESSKLVKTCMKCDYKSVKEFVLCDLKSSFQFKDHYFFQVALYFEMFRKLIGRVPALRVKRVFILKVSKEDGTYKIEDLKKPSLLARYCKHMLKTNEGIQLIKQLRK